MKIPARKTASRVTALRITAPEYRVDDASRKRVPLLSYADEQYNHVRKDCETALYLAVAGGNEVGAPVDGFDRLVDHEFTVHLDAHDRAIGLDVVPARLYGAKVFPTSQKDIKELGLQWDEETGVCQVTQRPVNLKSALIRGLITEIDRVSGGKSVKVGQKFMKNKATITKLEGGIVYIRIAKQQGAGQSVYEETGDFD